MHTGCPVVSGTKWSATKWIHTQPFRPETYRPGSVAEEPVPRPEVRYILDQKPAANCWPQRELAVNSWSHMCVPAGWNTKRHCSFEWSGICRWSGTKPNTCYMCFSPGMLVDGQDCEDSEPKCAQWAKAGECNGNPAFMVQLSIRLLLSPCRAFSGISALQVSICQTGHCCARCCAALWCACCWSLCGPINRCFHHEGAEAELLLHTCRWGMAFRWGTAAMPVGCASCAMPEMLHVDGETGLQRDSCHWRMFDAVAHS